MNDEAAMEMSDLLVVGGDAKLKEGVGELGARIYSKQEFDPQKSNLSCRVLLLVDPDSEHLTTFSKIWPQGGPLILIVSEDPTHAQHPRSLHFSPREAQKDSFYTLLRGLLRDRKEREAHQMLARVSHDMRSPMSVIKMACQLVKRAGGDEEKRLKHIAMIEESSMTIQTLIGDILDYSKLDHGTVALNVTTFDLPSLLHNVIESIRILANKKDLALELSMGANLPKMVTGDPGRLRQILGNLLSNSIKFTEAGSVKVKVWNEGDFAHFQVIDTGIGMRAESLEKIFQPYQQADSSIIGRFGGTGLGLNICQMLARKMGGDVSVSSDFGKGSCFSFHVRLPEVAERDVSTPLVDWRQIRVWLLGGKSSNHWVDQSRALGMQLELLDDNQAAVEKARSQGPDVLFFDLERGGFIELERILTQFPKSPPKVIVTTSAGQRGDGARCKALGVSGYLTSPFSFYEVQEFIQLVLQPENEEVITRHTLKERRG